MQESVFHIYPDYFTSFFTKVQSVLYNSGNSLYISNVSVYDQYSVFQVWFTMHAVSPHTQQSCG